MKNIFASLLSAALFFSPAICKAQFQVGSVTVTPSVLTTNLQVPWELVWGPDNFIWMTERYGRISRVNPANGLVLPLITIPDVQQSGESGLLGMALHPNFTQNPYVYVAYTYRPAGGQLTEKLVRYTYNGTTLAAPSILLDNINAASTHDGSRLLILPDLTMLMTTGDASTSSLAQNLTSKNGKVLRLNLDGSIPATNPIPNSYVYSFGHRNAQGLVKGPNNRLYSSEHGPGSDDELNEIVPNRNYGWPTVNGFCNTNLEINFCNANNVKEPLAAWTPTLAVAGIAYYNHPAIPGWQNAILMTALKATRLVQLALDPTGNAITSQTVYLNGAYGRLRAVCVSPDGKVYIGTSNKDGRGAPTALDDRIIVLQNLAYTPTGIKNNSDNKPVFRVVNQPGKNEIQFTFSPDFYGQEIGLYAVNGKQVLSKIIPEKPEMVLSTAGLPKGIYLVKALHLTKKVIVP